MNGALILLALFVGLPYVVMPLVILFVQKMDANPKLLPLLAAEIPAEVLPKLKGNTETLESLGFTAEAYLSMPQQMANIRAFVVLLTEQKTGDRASAITIIAKQSDGKAQINNYVEFSTRFESDILVNTYNSTVIGSFDPLLNEKKIVFAGMSDLRKMYQLHRFIIERVAEIGPSDPPKRHDPQKAAEFMATAMQRSYDDQVGTGLLRKDAPAGVYRPTLLGAFKMTWRLLPPLKQILTRKRDALAKKVLADFERERGS
jgi:hypothetical protein